MNIMLKIISNLRYATEVVENTRTIGPDTTYLNTVYSGRYFYEELRFFIKEAESRLYMQIINSIIYSVDPNYTNSMFKKFHNDFNDISKHMPIYGKEIIIGYLSKNNILADYTLDEVNRKVQIEFDNYARKRKEMGFALIVQRGLSEIDLNIKKFDTYLKLIK